MESKVELKPCPAGHNTLRRESDGGSVRIVCDCGWQGPRSEFSASAEELWNTRASTSSPLTAEQQNEAYQRGRADMRRECDKVITDAGAEWGDAARDRKSKTYAAYVIAALDLQGRISELMAVTPSSEGDEAGSVELHIADLRGCAEAFRGSDHSTEFARTANEMEVAANELEAALQLSRDAVPSSSIQSIARKVAEKIAEEVRREGFQGCAYQAVESLMDEIDEGEDDHALDNLIHILSPIIESELTSETPR